MKELQVPKFESYEEEATFWDNLDTADFMADDGEWFRFDTAAQTSGSCGDTPRNSGRTQSECSGTRRIDRNLSECLFK